MSKIMVWNDQTRSTGVREGNYVFRPAYDGERPEPCIFVLFEGEAPACSQGIRTFGGLFKRPTHNPILAIIGLKTKCSITML